MATMNVSLPDLMKDRGEAQAQSVPLEQRERLCPGFDPQGSGTAREYFGHANSGR